MDGNYPVLPRSATTASSSRASSRNSSPLDRLPTAGSGTPDTQVPKTRRGAGEVRGRGAAVVAAAGDDSGGGNGVGGLKSDLPSPRQAVQSVASAGGDRLQRLAMAEIGFADKELYAPKTGKAAGPRGRGGRGSVVVGALLCAVFARQNFSLRYLLFS